MAKAARKKLPKADFTNEGITYPNGVVNEDTWIYPHTKLIRLIDHVTSNRRDSNRKVLYYGRAGDLVGIISVREHVLLVVCGYNYVYGDKSKIDRIKVHGELGHRYPVDVSLTNYLDPDAKLVVRKSQEEIEAALPKSRPSYGAPTSTGNKKSKRSPY